MLTFSFLRLNEMTLIVLVVTQNVQCPVSEIEIALRIHGVVTV
jgi:hypothetical protein